MRKCNIQNKIKNSSLGAAATKHEKPLSEQPYKTTSNYIVTLFNPHLNQNYIFYSQKHLQKSDKSNLNANLMQGLSNSFYKKHLEFSQ